MKRLTALLLALALLLSACGGGDAKATSMRLRKTEGDVEVADKEGETLRLREDMGLYNGYGVETGGESFAWIDLDETKLTKMDEDTEIAIHKRIKKLSIEVARGSLFFNVTEPLADNETMEIQASDLLVGIRGTCGWVECRKDNTARVYLLEGKVECEAGEETVTVRAGEMAELTPAGALTVQPFTRDEVPAYILPEVADEPALVESLPDALPERPSAEEPAAEEPPVEAEPEIDHRAAAFAQYQALIDGAASNDYNPSGLPGMETGNYQYAYVTMQADGGIPALLLAAEYLLTADEMASPGEEPFYYQNRVLAFQYDEASGTVVSAGLNLRAGDIESGSVSELFANGKDGEAGLWQRVHQAGSEDPFTLYRVTISESLAGETAKFYEGPKSSMPVGIYMQAIQWQGIGEYQVPDIVREYEENPPPDPLTLPLQGDFSAYAGIYTPEPNHTGGGNVLTWSDVTLTTDGKVLDNNTVPFLRTTPIRVEDMGGYYKCTLKENEGSGGDTDYSEYYEYYLLYPAGVRCVQQEGASYRSDCNRILYYVFGGGVFYMLYYQVS